MHEQRPDMSIIAQYRISETGPAHPPIERLPTNSFREPATDQRSTAYGAASPVTDTQARGSGVANRMRALDPQESPAAQLGAELRALRLQRGLSLAGLGQLVHVSGALLGKIEKADRRPQPDLVDRLDRVLETDGLLARIAVDVHRDRPEPPVTRTPMLPAGNAVVVLRRVVDQARQGDHAMASAVGAGDLVAYARAAERVHGLVRRIDQPGLSRVIAEAYQLAGWTSFDQGLPVRAEHLLGTARTWAERAGDHALSGYILGPNLSFVATYGGDPARGVERAYGAIGWARRSGNRRMTAFAMTIAARAHARLREPNLCLDLLAQAEDELDRHVPDESDGGWLTVFDRPALDGHRGSCLLDLGLPQQAVDPLTNQHETASRTFVRNRVIWHLDRIDALLQLDEIAQACLELAEAAAVPAGLTPRVLRRFRALELRLRGAPATGPTRDALDRLHILNAAYA